jgi:hypothetical protein
MAEDITDPIETLRERGLSCARLKSLEKRENREAAEFRRVGFTNLASTQENAARQIKGLRKKVCLLR